MKKILIFSTAYFPFVGGAEVAVKEITDRIKDFEFDMITAKLGRHLKSHERVGNINVFRVGFGWPILDKLILAFYGSRLASKLHEKNKYDMTWSIMASYGGFAAMFFKKKFCKVPFLLTLQEGDGFDYILKRVSFLKPLFLDIFKNADHIQCISNYLAKWAKDNGAKSDVEVVPNGVDPAKFKNHLHLSDDIQPSINDFKNKLGIKECEKIIITTSRLVKKNGVSDLIVAMKFLPEIIKLLVVGGGSLGKDLKSKINELKLENRVLMVGTVRPEEISGYLRISDIFVRASLSEGLGNSFLEAMAAGLPVIGTKVGGIPDFLIDHETGLFCETNDPASIAEKIKILLADQELRNKLIKNGRELVEKKYDWALIADRMRDIFQKSTMYGQK
jgi:glycosyltransferase involved in cell wall biosynthesis